MYDVSMNSKEEVGQSIYILMWGGGGRGRAAKHLLDTEGVMGEF